MGRPRSKITDARDPTFRQRFIDEFLVDNNATAAAERAGAPPTEAAEIGVAMLKQTSVKRDILAAAYAPTERQKRFAKEYLVDLSAKWAAIRAGYDPRNADQVGHQLKEKPHIAALIEIERAAQAERTDSNIDRVLSELNKLAFADLRDIVQIGPSGEVIVPPLGDLDPNVTAAIKKIQTKKTTRRQGRGDDAEEIEEVTTTVELHDKKGSLELLGAHLGADFYGRKQANADPVLAALTGQGGQVPGLTIVKQYITQAPPALPYLGGKPDDGKGSA